MDPRAVDTLSKCADNRIAPLILLVPGIRTKMFNPSKYVTVTFLLPESLTRRSLELSKTIDERSSSTMMSSY